MKKQINVAMTCKLMPYYRLGVFQELSKMDGEFKFTFFGDTIKNNGIEPIPYSYANKKEGGIRWIKTKNYFYKPALLLWQTGIVSEIFKSKYKIFVFEGAVSHLPIWLFALLCKIRGKKVVYWTHGNRGVDKGIKKKIRIVFFKWLGDALLLYGNFQKNIMANDGYNSEKLHVIYNSLRPNEQFLLMDELQKSNAKSVSTIFKNPNLFTLIFIGRLAPEKGVITILETIDKLKKDNILVNCFFIGKGSEQTEMQNYIDKNGLNDQIHFAGEMYNEKDIAPYFMASNLMISPGNVGLNCIHSLAYGVPILTHDNFKYQNPEVEAIKNGTTGVFYKHGNFDDLVIKLKETIENQLPKDEVVNNCHQVIKEIYNPKNQSECIVSGLKKVMNG